MNPDIDPLTMFFTFALALFILSAKPGPDTLIVVSRTLSEGIGAAYMMLLGTLSAELIYLWGVSYGMLALGSYMDSIQVFFQVLGAALFIYLGVKGFTKPEIGLWKPETIENMESLDARDHKKKLNFWDNYVTGLSVCLGNPIIILFYFVAYPSIIDLSYYKLFTVYTASFMIIVFNIFPLLFIALIASKMKEFLTNEKIVRIINISASTLFIGIGLMVGLSAILKLSFGG